MKISTIFKIVIISTTAILAACSTGNPNRASNFGCEVSGRTHRM
ncbi:MAG: hypothetical protein Q4A24_04420 [Akkermansia sp.]|nr:hypothetical protein [Akkermansia sp.]